MTWSQTKSVVLNRTLLAKASKADGGQKAALEKRAVARAADPQFSIVVKHVGTPDEPMLWEAIHTRYVRDLALAEATARKTLLPMGDEEAVRFMFGAGGSGRSFADAVSQHSLFSDEHRKALSLMTRERIVHGVVGGEEEYHRLFKLGGPDLLQEAAMEVMLFNSISADTGED